MIRGLVLAGGGAKGSYQVGAYKALAELGWRPGAIAGTSVGCLNGAMFALDQWELAQEMWLTIGDGQVMETADRPAGWADFLQAAVERGGMDVSPLEATVRRAVDERALRRCGVRYGLVTVQKNTLRPLKLTLEEIPEGRLADYMLASAACFPAFQPRTIDGEQYIDGGWSDNMPFGLAARMGAEELLAVDIDGVGLTWPNLTGLPASFLRCYWDLGPILRFEPARAKRNIELGYQDCYRLFGRLAGTAYALRPEAEKELAERFVRPYARLLRAGLARSPALALAEGAALRPMEAFCGEGPGRALLPLERACELAGVDPVGVYTAGALCEAFLEKTDEAAAARFSPLLDGGEGLALRETAAAAAAPGEFLVALARLALTAGA